MRTALKFVANMRNRQNRWEGTPVFKTIGLYIFMVGGGVWHVLGSFETLMRLMAGPVIIMLAVWLFWEYDRALRSTGDQQMAGRFYQWSALVLISSFLVEVLGVKTGLIFGNYQYGATLKPQIFNVPLAIGFAWLSMLLSSVAVLQGTWGLNAARNPWRLAFLTAILMALFDFVMEPGAVKLQYWTWENGVIPLQNYAAWFFVSLGLMVFAVQRGLFQVKTPALAYHAFFAQFLYFAIVYWS